jgi:hypothetical protein
MKASGETWAIGGQLLTLDASVINEDFAHYSPSVKRQELTPCPS